MAASIFRAVFLVALVSLLTVAAPGVAAAADEAAAVNKVTNLNRKALEAYSKQDYDTARALLKEALEVCASAGLDKHAIRARTHIHFGVVAIVGFKQREVGLKQFRKALDVQPDIKLTKQLATPELRLNREDSCHATIVRYLSRQDHADGGRKRDTTRCYYFFRIWMCVASMKSPGHEPRGCGVGEPWGGGSGKELQPVIGVETRLFAEFPLGRVEGW